MRVNIGCGRDIRRGWLNVDILDINDPDYIKWDLRKGLPTQIRKASLIFQSHVIEHLTWEESINLYSQCRESLIQGGVLFLEIPDFVSTIRAYMEGDWSYFEDPAIMAFCKGNTLASLLDYALHQKVNGSPEHISFIDTDAVFYILQKAGFTKIAQTDYRPGVSNPDPLRRKYSIYFEATKLDPS